MFRNVFFFATGFSRRLDRPPIGLYPPDCPPGFFFRVCLLFFPRLVFVARFFYCRRPSAGSDQVRTWTLLARCFQWPENKMPKKEKKNRKRNKRTEETENKNNGRCWAHTHTHTHTDTHTHEKRRSVFFVVETVYKNGSPKKKRKATVRTMAVQRPVEEISGEKRERERERENEMKRQKKKCRSMGKWNFFFFLPPFRKPFRSSFRTDGNIRKSVRRVHIGR